MEDKIRKKILNLMRENEISYGELSRRTSLSKSTLQRYMTKEDAKLPIDRLKIIASGLGTTPAYLMGWESKDDFANNLMFFIRRTQTTKTEICQSLNITISTFQNWLSGNEYPTDEQLEKLSNILGVSKENLTSYNQVLIESNPPLDLRKGKMNAELNELYKQIDDNDLLITLFDKTKDLQKEDLEQILMIVDTFNKK